MSLEEWIIAAVRVGGSLLVLRWAFAGAIIAILVDLSDLFLKNFLDLGGVSNYQSFDKWLDQVYLLAFFAVAVRWANPAGATAVTLYSWRLAGFLSFEAIGNRAVLLFFPNVFEFFFVFVAWQRHWRPAFDWRPRNLLIVLAVCLVLKLGQEYVLHQGQWLDEFTTKDVLDWLWPFA